MFLDSETCKDEDWCEQMKPDCDIDYVTQNCKKHCKLCEGSGSKT